MNVRPSYFTAFFLLFLSLSAHSQTAASLSLNIGDSAPQLRIREWIKGTPVQRFERGTVYVLEFWATWCKPCIASLPRLSKLAGEFNDKVIVVALDIMEFKTTTNQTVRAFVDSMGNQMDFSVAAGDSNFLETDWFAASGSRGIPHTFVINAAGKLAWIGHPSKLAGILPQIVNETWNIKQAFAKWISDKRLAELDSEAANDLFRYREDSFNPNFVPRPDSALLAIDQIVKSEPKLKYAPGIAYHTFSSLLKIDPKKAYEYGKVVIVTETYEDAAYTSIYNVILINADKLNLPTEIYKLGAEAYQLDIDHIAYPEIANMPKRYHALANLYWHANQKKEAISAEQKAVEGLKNTKNFSKTDLAAYESRLQVYKQR